MRAIIAGTGDLAYFLAKSLAAKGHRVTVVDSDPVFCQRMADTTSAAVICGDPTLSHVLVQAGAEDADALLALTHSDPDNLMSCALGLREFGIPATVAVINDPDNRHLFASLGVTHTVSPVTIVSEIVSASVATEQIVNLIPLAEEGFMLMEVRIDDDADSAGKCVGALDMPSGAIVAAIIREGNLLRADPRTQLNVRDRVILIAKPEAQRAGLEALGRLK